MDGLPAICLVVFDDVADRRERKMIAHRHDPVGRDAVQDRLARVDRLRGVVVEDRRSLEVLQARHRVMGDVAHMHELLLARGEQDRGMRRRMSRCSNIAHAAGDFAALPDEPDRSATGGRFSRAAPIVPFLNGSGSGL